MRCAWLTDIHLNFLAAGARDAFLSEVAALAPGAVLLGGDIGEAHDLIGLLESMAAAWPCPLYFVLGNHDYYYGSVRVVRREVLAWCRLDSRRVYLSAAVEPIELVPGVGLVGHDGWADARLGDYDRSLVRMVDFQVIEELIGHSKPDRRRVLEALGDEAAAHVRRVLAESVERFERTLLVTHVPPLREACWHQGQISDDHWAPHFTCHAVGQAITEVMSRHPQRRLTVLCGHTHGEGRADPLPNVEVLTGGADYGAPRVQMCLEL